MPRNRYQRGSIKVEPRAQGPWYVLRFHNWIRQADGSEKRKEKRVPLGPVATIGTKSAAMRLAQPHLDNVNLKSFSFLREDIAFTSFFELFLDDKKIAVRKSTNLTRECYGRTFKQFFARHKLSQMNSDDFQSFIRWMVEQKYAPTTIHNNVQLLKQAWKWGRSKKYPVDADAFLDLTLPAAIVDEQRCFTAEECFRIIVDDVEPFKTMEWILFDVGMRPGECIPISRRSLSFVTFEDDEYTKITVLETVSPRTGEVRPFGKTVNANRTPAASPELTVHLKAFLETVQGDYLFTQPDRKMITYRQFWEHLRERCESLGIPGPNLKAFRHANATTSSSLGTPAAVITKRLGHYDEKFTRKNYMHAIPADEFALAKKLGKILQMPSDSVEQVVEEESAKVLVLK